MITQNDSLIQIPIFIFDHFKEFLLTKRFHEYFFSKFFELGMQFRRNMIFFYPNDKYTAHFSMKWSMNNWTPWMNTEIFFTSKFNLTDWIVMISFPLHTKASDEEFSVRKYKNSEF